MEGAYARLSVPCTMHVSRGGGVLTAIRTLLFHEPGSGFDEGQDELAGLDMHRPGNRPCKNLDRRAERLQTSLLLIQSLQQRSRMGAGIFNLYS